jgi:uncharacterized membrane protein
MIESLALMQSAVTERESIPMWPPVALAAATVAAGLSAGVFYTFQVSITPALAKVDDEAYVSTFHNINRAILNPWFLSVFMGAPLLIAGAVALYWREDRPIALVIAVGLALQVATVLITGAGNVPLNDQLDKAGVVSGPAATAARVAFEASWNRLNAIRTATSVASFVALGVAAVMAIRN